MAEVLTPEQLKRLTQHKYSAEGSSLLEPHMQIFWRWLVEQVPLWWAPNAITLLGLMCNVFTTFILIVYSPDAQQEVPRWSILLSGVGLFIYQSLDAIDGKQARRTNTATPLGELFDHGCDSVSTVFVVMGTCIALQLGEYPKLMFLVCFTAMFIFYAAHWQTYCSGTLKFGQIDVTEAQFGVIFIYLMSGLFTPYFWKLSIPLTGLTMLIFPVVMSLGASVLAGQAYFKIIFVQGGVGRHGSTVAGTSVLSPMLPICGVIFLAFIIWQKSPSHVYELHPVLYIMSFGMVAAKITNKLVVAHMTKSEMGFWDRALIGPLMLFLNQYFGSGDSTPISEYFVLWICFFYCLADLSLYSYQVCMQICNYLDIYCFKITPPSKSKTTDSANGNTPSPASLSSSSTSSSSTTSSHYTPPSTRQRSAAAMAGK